jgi:hypothetical protein
LSPLFEVSVFILEREQNCMRKACFRWLCLLPILLAGPAWGAQGIKSIQVAVSNPSSTARRAADIVIPIAEIRKVAPDFKPGALIVTVSDASALEEDAAVLQTEELPRATDQTRRGRVDLAGRSTVSPQLLPTCSKTCFGQSSTSVQRPCQRNDGHDNQTPVCVGVRQSQPAPYAGFHCWPAIPRPNALSNDPRRRLKATQCEKQNELL